MALQSGRRQSSRQVRTSTTRPHNYYARHFASQPVNVATPTDEEPGFFPAITHFTDAADALPREVMRHFSMLKEVEAKLHAPDEDLAKLADQIGKISSLKRKTRDGSIASASGSGNALNGSSGSSMTAVDTSDLERRQLYRKLNYSVAVMAPMLDEKIAVLSTGNMTLTRQLERMESSYQHIPEEVSDEARLGSITHWAYMAEKETKKAGAERTRREVAATNNLAAAAAAVHDQDVAAARSEARREAVLARKIRNQHVDSDFEDRPVPRRPYGKNRKQAEANTAADAKSHGLGAAPAPGGPGKRRKNAASASVIERSISGAVGRVRGVASPTPGSEVGKKRKNPPGPIPGKKRLQTAGGQSPRLVSSPLVGSFSAKETGPKPANPRARQNSQSTLIHATNIEAIKARPSSSSSNKPITVPLPSVPTIAVPEQPQPTVERLPGPSDVSALAIDTTNNSAKVQEDTVTLPLKNEDVEVPVDTAMVDAEQIVATVVTTRVGRVSKTATPVMGSFPDIPARTAGRGSRTKEAPGGTTSHASSESGKGTAPSERIATRDKRRRNGTAKAESAAEARKSELDAAQGSEHGEEADGEDDGEEAEENEPRYCYCNEVSYGEMVACDNENCSREWFHLRCAGLKEAPGEDSKWFCDECKILMKEGKRGQPAGRKE